MTPADELRAAAEQLRTLATAASIDSDGVPTANWHHEDRGRNRGHLYGDHLTRDDGRCISWPHLLRGGSAQRPTYMHVQHAAYAAAMGPVVGLALADWLDQAARYYEAGVQAADDVFRDDPAEHEAFLTTGPGAPSEHALAVARQINGTTP
ncbi:hypothetical protein [Streptomyces flaveolus]|uniref:hypothetical protein n=1 Tax=Streptomyces flaveolus TaxID=67297 RepID=UPI0016716EB2|nr:hypothetical protein [Streptomyces flaveolus]GGQ83572.1 hypothetical protein GCM10010216_51760 [Streptomyces flaveolus]